MSAFKEQGHHLNEKITALTALGVTCMTGLMGNMFIIAAILKDWIKGNCRKASEIFLFSLAISRMSFQCVCVLDICYSLFLGPGLNMDIKYSIIDFFLFFFNYAAFWFVLLLSVLYFCMVTNHNRALYLHLKAAISERAQLFVIAAVLVSFCNASLFIWAGDLKLVPRPGDFRRDIPTNETWILHVRNTYLILLTLGNWGPLIIYCTSFILLINSLCLQMKRMKSYEAGFARTHLDSYYIAIKSMVTCFSMCCIAVIINIVLLFHASLFNMISYYICMNIYPTVHTSYLICRTPKLKEKIFGIRQHLPKCIYGKRGHPSGGELAATAHGISTIAIE